MSGPHDHQFDKLYELYYPQIRRFLSLKADMQTAEDLAQVTFMKAMANLSAFRGESSLFTWLSTIAANTLKNEYRRKHRSVETPANLSDMDQRYITVAFTSNVELRIDISRALVRLNQLDRDIISLHYDVGCTLKEAAELLGMRTSAVKNRLYRALAKLRSELQHGEDQGIMSIIDSISIVNKDGGRQANAADRTPDQAVIAQLSGHVDRICALFRHRPSTRLTIEVYPDLHAFHQAVHEPDAPNWFMGTIDGNTIRIASPLHPGPEHTYESILKSTVHLFAMWLVKDINPSVPKWIYQGIGGYEAGLMTKDYIRESVAPLVGRGDIPTFAELEDQTWDFETKKGFQFTYLLCEFVLTRYGVHAMNQWIRTPNDFEAAFRCTAEEFHDRWAADMRMRLNGSA